MFLEIWSTVYCPKDLDTSNIKLLLEIEKMFNDKFRNQPIWTYDTNRQMYYTLLFFGALPFLTSQSAITSKYKALNKYGFLDKDLKPFPVDNPSSSRNDIV